MRAHLAVLLIAAAAVLASCGDDPSTSSTQPEGTTQRESTVDQPASPPLRPPPCPPELGNCERAAGTIAYVERVDPDGDGDAHFVLLSGASVTAPGLTIIDVRRDLRPHPLPGPGAELAAAGPVYPGSRGQLQIEAVAIRTR